MRLYKYYLAINSQAYKHYEKGDGPEMRRWKVGKYLGVDNKHQLGPLSGDVLYWQIQ